MVDDWTDAELVEELSELDADDGVTLTEWEVQFFESVSRWDGALTEKQRAKAITVLKKYGVKG